MLKSFTDIYQAVQQLDHVRTISVAMADDESVLSALRDAEAQNICHAMLVGDPQKIRTVAGQVDYPLREDRIVAADNDVEIAQRAVDLVRSGAAEILMKGHISTPILMKAVLDRETGLRKGDVLSHVAVAEIPTYPKLFLLSDGGINILPDLEKKEAILQNILSVSRQLGIDHPKVAALGPIEKVNPKIPETVDAAELQKNAQAGKYGDILLEGPIAMDVALSAEAAQRKGITSQIAGDADIFLVPDITCGNVAIKVLMRLANAKVGGVVVGAKVPIILLSRSDKPEEKLNSISLSILLGD